MQNITRKLLIFGSLVLPFVTGTIAVVGRYKDPWSGFEKPPLETFVNYALPIPVAMGCFQLICWPLTIGIVCVMSHMKKQHHFFIGVFLVLMTWGAIYLINPEDVPVLYVGADIALILIVMPLSLFIYRKDLLSKGK